MFYVAQSGTEEKNMKRKRVKKVISVHWPLIAIPL